MKQAKASFRRVKGFAQMPALIAALEESTRTAHTKPAIKNAKAA